ncbi:MAG: hypothetical protein QNJ12_11015 [Ilumatobacter sp.]|uniref:sunset domain-containing protein n=1 Tax=Ilumatobacter sp. TaxID=1967498 RepID=UPI0026314E7D|nr:hypothetical protein [Ilumatobacter sp.]MDJ0769319.1 hypothetical protein [Ilumatobacter sp.]
MLTLLRRAFWLALLGGAGYAVWTTWQRQHEATGGGPAEWPPMAPAASSGNGAVAATTSAFAEVSDADLTAAAATDDAAEAAESEPAAADEAAPSATAPSGDAPSGEARWIEPTDGACPVTHPIKANDNSGIYHVPGGRFYERTGAERCYASEADAEADGYRRAKS